MIRRNVLKLLIALPILAGLTNVEVLRAPFVRRGGWILGDDDR